MKPKSNIPQLILKDRVLDGCSWEKLYCAFVKENLHCCMKHQIHRKKILGGKIIMLNGLEPSCPALKNAKAIYNTCVQ